MNLYRSPPTEQTGDNQESSADFFHQVDTDESESEVGEGDESGQPNRGGIASPPHSGHLDNGGAVVPTGCRLLV